MKENNKTYKNSKLETFFNIFFIIIGGIIAGYGLESILIPNSVSDGGVTGISIMLSAVTGVSLSIYIILLNLPFLFLGYKQIGKTFAIRSLIGIISLSISTSVLHHVPTIIESNPFLVVVSGGVLLGIGMGLALRNGGALDGTDMLAVLIAKNTPFSTGDIIIAINIVIFSFATLVFGIEGAISSLISYYIATKVIEVIEVGFDDSKSVKIISSAPEEIGEAIQSRLGRSVTYTTGTGGFSKEKVVIIHCVINRMEESKMKQIIKHFDNNAFVTFSDVAEVKGGNFKKRDIH
ncbi:hypothetical protein CVD28_24485 [Bacillus sp. M6-12]|uniref:YitT family protein n=1 Tax=Bacillus sp. M6-12 TaxID=2054166 RepID=UPI000C78B392|nr:YitT family protein [Bacillus sp. M6-12]PLS15041.1 hypothetical protein CVD28_24485 [Bacillus sp. M6-12]